MVKVLLLLALAVSLTSVALALVFSLPALAAAGGLASGGVLGVDIALDALRRDRRVRLLIVAAYQADAPHTRAGDLVRVLGTPDVVQARSAYLRREDLRRAQMYANGDASDY